MALTAVQQNIASKMQDLARRQLEIKNELGAALAMYTTEGMTTVNDADYAELTEFAHVTVADMNAAKNTLTSLNTTLGDYGAGEGSLYLSRILNSVPS